MGNKVDRNDLVIALGILLDSNESVRLAVLSTQTNPGLQAEERGRLKNGSQTLADKAQGDFAMFMVGK